MNLFTDSQFDAAMSGKTKDRFPTILTKNEAAGVVADNMRSINFDIIRDLSMEAADRIDKSANIDDLLSSIEKRVQMLTKITGGYNSKKVSELCGKHIIADIKSMDSAHIRSRWTH